MNGHPMHTVGGGPMSERILAENVQERPRECSVTFPVYTNSSRELIDH